MQIAVVGAGFNPGEADRLRRSLATFKRMGTIGTFRDRFVSGDAGARLRRRLSRPAASPDRGLRRIRLPRKPCGQLRAAGLYLRLAEVPPSGGLHLRAAELASRWASTPPPSSCAMPARPRGRGAPRLGQSQRLGQHAGTSRRRRPGPAARLPADQGACAKRMRPGSWPRGATAIPMSKASGGAQARPPPRWSGWPRPMPSPASA